MSMLPPGPMPTTTGPAAEAEMAAMEMGAGQPPNAPPVTHDVTITRTKKLKQARVMGVPPEEFGIERHARTIRDCNYCFHKIVTKTEADLIEDGFDSAQVKKLPSHNLLNNSEEQSRNTVDEEYWGQSGENSGTRIVEITEHYIRLDYEGDGKVCLYKITTGGGQDEVLKRDGKLDIEEFDSIPFASTTPVPITHRFFGRSIADVVMPIQREKTALKRGALDNLYLHNNPRVEVPETSAGPNTLDDLLVSRPGGIVRTKVAGGLQWQVVPDITGSIWPAMQYLDHELEVKTGVTRQSQGVDANALQNQSATAVNQVFSASQMRMKLIARITAEGVKDLFSLLHQTIRKHGQEAQTVRLRNKWIQVDPRQWKTRDDMTIHVGLGNGGKSERFAQTMAIANFQKECVLGGKTNIVDDSKIYNTGAELSKILGHKNPDKFFNDPDEKNPQTGQPMHPAPPPKPDPKVLELQIKGQQAQMQAQLDQKAAEHKAQIEQIQAQADIATQDRKTQAEMAMAQQKAQFEAELKSQEHELKMTELRMQMQMHQQKHQTDMAGKTFDLNSKVVEHGMKPKEDGTVDVHPAVKEAVSGVMDALTASHEHLSKLIAAPRKNTLHRDPKTGKASHSVSTIEGH